MKEYRVHLRYTFNNRPACGAGGAFGLPGRGDMEVTDDIMEVTCLACPRTTSYRRVSMQIIPRDHPSRVQR